MRSFATALFVAGATAVATDFPRFDSMHAHCAMNVTFEGVTCNSLYQLVDYQVRAFENGDKCSQPGFYGVFEENESSYVWSTRETANKKYVDDQLFEFTQSGNTCQVAAKSRSQSLSYYDYSVNYCNMWNILSEVGTFTIDSVKDCKYPADDPTSVCARY